MKKNKIEILALIDRSGSMSIIIEEAVGAFNSFIKTQKELNLNDKVKVTLASFDDKYEIVFDRVPLHKVPKLKVKDVQPRGMTALYDSVGKLINGAKYPKRDTVLLIQTDGWENASSEFTNSAIRKLIASKEKDGWDINFIGAGIDKKVGIDMGVKASKSYSVAASVQGMQDFSDTISFASSTYRSSKSS